MPMYSDGGLASLEQYLGKIKCLAGSGGAVFIISCMKLVNYGVT